MRITVASADRTVQWDDVPAEIAVAVLQQLVQFVGPAKEL